MFTGVCLAVVHCQATAKIYKNKSEVSAASYPGHCSEGINIISYPGFQQLLEGLLFLY